MYIHKILVDEYPESCRECPMCRTYSDGSLKDYGTCKALVQDNNTVCTGYMAAYRRHDCPMVKVNKVVVKC